MFKTFLTALWLGSVFTLAANFAPAALAQTMLSGGFSYMCALEKTEGTVRCWGTPNKGGSSTPSNLPHAPLALSGVVSLAAGGRAACALRNDGAVLCWGDNNYYMLGDATTTASLIPLAVAGVGGAVDLTSGSFSDHICAISADFLGKCWGRNDSGQLGNGNFRNTHIPQTPAGLGAVSAMAAGYSVTCAVTLGGAAKCWGFGGLLGDGTGNSRPAPTQVVGLTTGVVDLAAGFQHACALLANGTVKCWGNNAAGQLGNGTLVGGLSPVDVLGISNAVQIALGRDSSCARLATGEVRCWGDGRYGGAPDGVVRSSSNYRQSTPVALAGLSGPAVTIGASGTYLCAAVVSGLVECWGEHPTGALSFAQEAKATAHLGGFSIDTRLVMAEYRHASLDYFFITSRAFEKLLFKAAVPAFQATGKSFNVFPTNLQAGSAAITRFYFDQVAKGNTRGSHFYTLVESERAALTGLNPGNAAAPRVPYSEGVDSFAFAPAVEGIGGSCAGGLTPLYRAFRGARFPDDPNHRFTTDLALYNTLVTAGWDGEGVKMCVSP
jgi:Regulator of chromosome condensation (RCC1) repeat